MDQINRTQAWKEFWGVRPDYLRKSNEYVEQTWVLPDLFIMGRLENGGWIAVDGYWVVPRNPESDARAQASRTISGDKSFSSHGRVLTSSHYHFVDTSARDSIKGGYWNNVGIMDSFWQTAPRDRFGTVTSPTKAAYKVVLDTYKKKMLAPGNRLKESKLHALKPEVYFKKERKSPVTSKKPKEKGSSVDYALWCIMTGDEEDTRLSEDTKSWLKGWKADGVPVDVLKKLDNLFTRGYNGGWDSFNYNSFKTLLWPYRTHKSLKGNAWYDWVDEIDF